MLDLENGIITIRNAKKEKDRLVPLHFNLAPVFTRYCITSPPKDRKGEDEGKTEQPVGGYAAVRA